MPRPARRSMREEPRRHQDSSCHEGRLQTVQRRSSGTGVLYNSSFPYGPNIQYELTTGKGRGAGNIAQPRGGGGFPTHATFMMATDGAGKNRSYLASEDTFRFLKDLQTRNMRCRKNFDAGGTDQTRRGLEGYPQVRIDNFRGSSCLLPMNEGAITMKTVDPNCGGRTSPTLASRSASNSFARLGT
jgi:hypothetical protein